MKFILFVGHGSRDMAGNKEILEFVQKTVDPKQYPHTEACFLEFCDPDVTAGVENCISKGATHVYVIPIILFPAGHSKIHIPAFIDAAKKRHPQVGFSYAKPIDVDARLIHILEDRLREVEPELEDETVKNETAILIVGRGSSDPDANSTLSRIARLFWEQHRFLSVEIAFMGITEPTLEDGLERCRRLGAKKTVVLPYFLFTGILIERMKKMVHEYGLNQKDVEVSMSNYMGFHPLLGDIILHRISEVTQESVSMNCDLCKYRIEADTGDVIHHYGNTQPHSHDHA
ncbi:MAG: sirohydrochlorin chelatase [Leptospirales bacterium]